MNRRGDIDNEMKNQLKQNAESNELSDQIDAETSTNGEVDLFAEIERLQSEVDENLENYERAVAELANYRRRREQETGRLIQQARNGLLTKLLPVADDFDRAVRSAESDAAPETWLEGFRLIEKKFWTILEAEGVRPMTSVGEPFDPNLHEAVMVDSVSEEADTVVEEFQRGYFVNDQVLRPAIVKVGSLASIATDNE